MKAQDRLEEELRNALRREEAPAGLAERVLARAERETAERAGFWQRILQLMQTPSFRLAATVALFIVMVSGALEYRRYERERAAGEAAKQQLMLALRITGQKLQYAQQKVNSVGSQQYEPATEEKAQ